MDRFRLLFYSKQYIEYFFQINPMKKRNIFWKVMNKMKLIVFILLYSQIQRSKAQAVKISHLETVNTYVGIFDNENLFPVPVSASGSHVSVQVLKGKPFTDIPGTVYFNPGDRLNYDTVPDQHTKVSIQSLRLYLDTSTCKIKIHQFGVNRPVQFRIEYLINKNLSSFFYPFYFKKCEVTNKEYRQFTKWVRDSVARMQLAAVFPDRFLKDTISKQLNWETPIGWGSKDSKIEEVLEYLYFPQEATILGRKEFDTDKFIYNYKDDRNVIQNVAVYPDTIRYFEDVIFSSSGAQVFYFSHAGFDDYPVVGVNYYQAKAFCHWKNQQLHNLYDRRDCNFEYEADLPNDNEWEYVTNRYIYENGKQTMADFNCLTDLIIPDPSKPISYFLNATLYSNLQNVGGSCQDGFRWTHKADICKIKGWRKNEKLALNRDELGISGMGDNVSEWMNETYQDNWRPYLQKRKRILSSIQIHLCDSTKPPNKIGYLSFDQGGSKDTIYLFDKIMAWDPGANTTDVRPTNFIMSYSPTYYDNLQDQINIEIPLILGIENFYDERSGKDGQLVRGGNWFDERYSVNRTQDIPQRNIAGINAKTFVSPSKTCTTIGFRYVVRIKPKVSIKSNANLECIK